MVTGRHMREAYGFLLKLHGGIPELGFRLRDVELLAELINEAERRGANTGA